MKKTIFGALAAALLAITAMPAAAQTEDGNPANPYRYTYHTDGGRVGYAYRVERTLKINWKPETEKTVQRYTVAVNPTLLFNHGLKFDFEYELPTPGEWLQVGLTGYYAPERTTPHRDDWHDYWHYYGEHEQDYDRYLPASSWDGFRKMWGAGVSVLYKKMFHRRGWYFSTGLAVNYFRVGYMDWGYVPFEEDGLTFYRENEFRNEQSFVKPSVEFNIGKHFALSRRCFFDLYVGTRVSWSIYKHRGEHQEYNTMYGFGYRGIEAIHGGVRFGVLLW